MPELTKHFTKLYIENILHLRVYLSWNHGCIFIGQFDHFLPDLCVWGVEFFEK